MDHVEATIREVTTRLRGLLVDMPGQIKQLQTGEGGNGNTCLSVLAERAR